MNSNPFGMSCFDRTNTEEQMTMGFDEWAAQNNEKKIFKYVHEFIIRK